jgi:hypothetical protein
MIEVRNHDIYAHRNQKKKIEISINTNCTSPNYLFSIWINSINCHDILENWKNPEKKVKKWSKKGLLDLKSQESSTIRKYVRGMSYTQFDAQLNADSAPAYSIARTEFRREKISTKTSKIAQSWAPDIKSPYLWTIRTNVRDMNYTPFAAELNADSESAHSIARTYLWIEVIGH